MPGVLPYIGGKSRLANQIIELLPSHHTYVELFSGGASVLLRKAPSKVEVLNDLDDEVTNVFRVCQLHHEELIRYMQFMVSGRSWFELLKRTDPTTLTDLQRAARYIYLQKNTYAGMVARRGYNPGTMQNNAFNIERLPGAIKSVHVRMARVQIENQPYEQVLKRYDRDTTVFFADPPYYGPKYYRFNFNHEDFVTLAKRLGAIKGKFLLSLNDVAEVRKLFHKFKFRDVDLHYSAQKKAGQRFRELLITNY